MGPLLVAQLHLGPAPPSLPPPLAAAALASIRARVEVLDAVHAALQEVVLGGHRREAFGWLPASLARLPLPPAAARRLLLCLLPDGPPDAGRRRHEVGEDDAVSHIDVSALPARQAAVLACEHLAPQVGRGIWGGGESDGQGAFQGRSITDAC